jgi:hypothetical protein
MNSDRTILTQLSNESFLPKDDSKNDCLFEFNFKINSKLKNDVKKYNFNIMDFTRKNIKLEELLIELNHLCNFEKRNRLTDVKLLCLESYKLFLMKTVKNIISSSMPKKRKKLKPKISITKKYFNYLMFGALSFGGMLLDAIGNFIAAISIFNLVPFVSPIILIFSAIGIAVINTIIFLGFDIRLLGNKFGILFSSPSNKLYDVYDDQIKITKTINRMLLKTNIQNNLSSDEKSNFKKIISTCNNDIVYKNNSLQLYREKPSKKIARYAVTAVGLVTAIGGNYFFASALLTILGTSLLGTPLGWAIVGGCMAIGVGYFLSKGAANLYALLNPNANRIKVVKEKLSDFVKNNYINSADYKIISSDTNALLLSSKKFQDCLLKENISLKNKLNTSSTGSDNDSSFSQDTLQSDEPKSLRQRSISFSEGMPLISSGNSSEEKSLPKSTKRSVSR